MDIIEFWLIAVALLTTLTAVNPDPVPDPAPLAAPDPGRQQGVASPPEITEHPKDIIVQRNAGARFYCRARGNPQPAITWLKDGKPFDTDDGQVVLMPTGEMIFLGVSRASEGTYQCVAKNPNGVATSLNATLKVAYIRDDFRTSPKDMVAAVGEIAIIECAGPKGVPEPSIFWTQNGIIISPSNRLLIKNGNLIINSAQISDSGTYVCKASNIAGTRESISAVLRVQEPPKFTTKPQDITLKVGDELNLICQVSGDPRPRVSWSKKEGVLNKLRLVPVGTGNLRIANMQPEDEGTYICQAENGVARITANAEVIVQTAPEYTRYPTDQTVSFGSVITLPCASVGSPKPVIIWHTNGGQNMFIDNTYDGGHIIVNSDGDLTIYNVKFEDEGEYTCQAVSPVGQITTSATLKVINAKDDTNIIPPLIQQGPSNQTVAIGDTVELTCESRSLPTPEISWFFNNVKINLDDHRKYVQTSSGSLRIFEAKMSDSGVYKCAVSNEYGQSTWEANVRVKVRITSFPPIVTPSNLPGPPSAPMLVNTTSNSIALSWDPSTFTGASSLKGYMLQYYGLHSTSSSWTTIEDKITKPAYMVGNLNPSSTYVFVVRAINSHGTSDPSSPSNQIVTKGASRENEDTQLIRRQLSQSRINLQVSKASGGNLRVTWETDLNCDVIHGFMILLQAVSMRNGVRKTYSTSCFVRSYDLSGISPGISYEIRIQAYKGQVTGSPSPIVLASLESGGVTPALPTFQVKSNNPEDGATDAFVATTFSWTTPADIMQEYISGYVIRCHDDAMDYDRSISVNGSTHEVKFNDLPPETKFTAFVIYSTQLGPGMQSKPEKFTTPVLATPAKDGFIGMLQSNPMILIAIIVAVVLLLLIILVGIYCYRKKKNPKANGLHGRQVPGGPRYTGGFNIVRKDAPIAHANGTTGSGASSAYTGSHLNNDMSKHRHDTTTSTDNGNGKMYSDMTQSSNNQHMAGPFSYVTDQLTNITSIAPQFSSPHLQNSPQTAQQENIQFQTFHSNASDNGLAMNPDQFIRQHNSDTHAMTQMHGLVDEYPPPYGRHASSSDLPPPPPSPPLSQKTSITNRSRGSSCKNSGNERQSSHSRERLRRRAQPPTNVSIVSSGRPTDTDTGIDSPQQTPSPPRPGDLMLAPNAHHPNHSYNPAYKEHYAGKQRGSGIAMQYGEGGYLAGPSGGETETEFDSMQRPRRPYNNFVQKFKDNNRESVAVSGVSMMGEIGSESELSCGRESPVSSDESIGMESASQVGPNLHHNINAQASAFVPINRGEDYHTYSHAGTNQYDARPQIKQKPYNNHKNYPTNAVYDNRNQQNSRSYARINSASSSESSYQQNTADSGLSAGVGSLGHNSIHSTSSIGSVNKPLVPRSHTSGQLSSESHNINNMDSEFSSLGRMNDKTRLINNYPKNRKRAPPVKSPHTSTPTQNDQMYETNEYTPMVDGGNSIEDEPSRSRFLKIKSVFAGGENLKNSELAGVPEASTSDFCEDYSDRSQ